MGERSWVGSERISRAIGGWWYTEGLTVHAMLDRLKRHLPALPYPHFMAFAPLDCWARMLFRNGTIGRIVPRYWLRLAGVLCTSAIGTVLTLPERLVLAVVGRVGGGRSWRARSGGGGLPEVLVVLGYYRSGTTHLHYVLSCDPSSVTPRWHQALAPQGWALSWTLLRYVLVPFLSSRRPQDDVAYGPEYPAEDDFAVCNSSAMCAMPGRMVLPGEWAYYKRLHGFEGATEKELAAFARAQMAFTRRIAMLNPGKRLLLKTPSHTARVSELVRIYGEHGVVVKFVHISREAGAVVKSNVAMHQRFEPFLLQPHPGEEEIRRRVVEEYDQTERAFVAQASALGPGRVAQMRYQDLIADPMGEIARVYAELSIPLSPEARARMSAYLESVKAYRTAGERERAREGADSGGRSRTTLDAREQAALAWMAEQFGHTRGAGAPKPEARAEEGTRQSSVERVGEAHEGGERMAQGRVGKGEGLSGFGVAAQVGMWCIALWLVAAHATGDRMDWLIWPTGVAVGLSALKVARKGSVRLGAWCACVTVLVVLVAAFPATWLADYPDVEPVPWEHVWLSTRRGVSATNNVVWMVLGVLSAYRFGSREHVRPPGM